LILITVLETVSRAPAITMHKIICETIRPIRWRPRRIA